MRVTLARPRGFCAGVNMAVEALDKALELYGAPVYVYHEIVHNKHVVDTFRDKGAIFIDRIEEAPVGATLVFSAHGVSPEIRQQARDRGIRAIDATCPLVTKVHSEAIRFARQGHLILLIGHDGHDEIVGTIGEAPGRMKLVQSPAEVDELIIPEGQSVAYLSQTTLSVDDANAIVDRLKGRFPAIIAPPSEDICYATQNRQEAVREIALTADVVLVIGSQNSSNSMRLREIAEEMGVRAYLIDSANEIQEGWLDGAARVAVTAGASAPEGLVAECVRFLESRYHATVEERVVRQEDMHFQLPVELRREMGRRALAAAPAS